MVTMVAMLNNKNISKYDFYGLNYVVFDSINV